MNFTPFLGYVEVEPLSGDSSLLASDDRKWIEAAKVIGVNVKKEQHYNPSIPGGVVEFEVNNSGVGVGDIIFFRPHGFFETPEYEGRKHYVVRVSEEFILGRISKE